LALSLEYLFWIVASNVVSVAVVGGLVGLWLKTRIEQSIQHEYARKLEEFKQEAALASEIARRRIDIVANAWSAIARFEAASVKHKLAVGRFAWQLLQQSGHIDQNDSPPPGLMALYERLAAYPEPVIPTSEVSKLDELLKDPLERLTAAAAEAHEIISTNRFWLGGDLQKELKDYLKSLVTLFGNLSPIGEDREHFRSSINALKAKQYEATALLPRLSTKS